MSKTPLYQVIAESIRRQIAQGVIHPGEELPTVRATAKMWQCAPGTALRAYQELAEQGLVISRPGSGTRVAPDAMSPPDTQLRRARLVNLAEEFLLRAVASGYSVEEIQPAFQLALDRYRALAEEPQPFTGATLRFVGSHDPAISTLAARLAEDHPGNSLDLSFAGSLGGLIALAGNRADIAGAHLWDEETDSYNRPFVRRLLPGKRSALVSLADRHIGLIVAPGNPLGISGLADLAHQDVRFLNRQPGAGTRVWLDIRLRQLGIGTDQIHGYENEALTHVDVASAVRDGRVDAGLGIETVALAFGLDFILLTTERYDLIIPEDIWGGGPAQALVALLQTEDMRAAIDQLGGYETARTGAVEWVN